MENNSINSLNINLDIAENIDTNIESLTGLLKRPTEGNISSPLPCSDEQYRNSNGRFWLKILNNTVKIYLINF